MKGTIMKRSVQAEIKKIIKEENLNCTIKEFKDSVDWDYISEYQKLSEEFIKEFKDKLYIKIQKSNHHRKYDPIKEATKYAKKHKLEIKDGYLYAFRNHDMFGRGSFDKTISYEPNIYYRDWHCDLNPKNENSFGLGIWPKGNTKVKVHLNDFGCEVKTNKNGKARVWGFEID